jgi:hypothetical protein
MKRLIVLEEGLDRVREGFAAGHLLGDQLKHVEVSSHSGSIREGRERVVVTARLSFSM